LNCPIINKYHPKNLDEYKYYESISYTQCIFCKHKEPLLERYITCHCKNRRYISKVAIDKFKVSRAKTDNKNYIIGARKREDEFDRRSKKEGRNIRLDWKTEEIKLNQSILMKKRILDGYTPPVTNTFCNSRVYINGIPFRSTWEGFFYLKNKDTNIQYEKIKIEYFDSIKNKNRVYITDFLIDNTIYEIKPEDRTQKQNNLDKEKALIKWCDNNGYMYKLITDKWFFENYDESIIYKNLDFMELKYRNKMIRNLKIFKKGKE